MGFMKKNFKRAVAVMLSTALVITAAPIADKKAKAAESPNPLTTIWNTAEIGTHEGTGSCAYDATTGTVTITGAGTKYDKDNAKDDYFLAFFKTKGAVSITAKMTVKEGTTGMAGIVIRDDAEEVTSNSAALYADIAKAQFRYGYTNSETVKGGASKLQPASISAVTDSVYVRVLFNKDQSKYEYYIADNAEFTDAAAKGQGITAEPAVVGFFATEGVTVEFSEIEIKTTYTDDNDKTVKKIVFSSKYGEMIPTWTKSTKYDADFEFTTTVNGNEITAVSTRGANKGDIRSDKMVDYFLFPAIAENMTVSADITIKSINNGTDKQGIGVGQFALDGSTMRGDFIQANKNMAMQHNYATDSSANGGNPKSGSNFEFGDTFKMCYTKTVKDIEGTLTPVGVMMAYDANGNVYVDGTDYAFDYSNGAKVYGAGKEVQYGLAISAAEVVIANLTLTNEDGYVVYDQNDYYIAVGVAPEVTEITSATVADDRNSIDLKWTFTEGVGNQIFKILVSKDGGDFELAGTSKTGEYSFLPAASGSYTFKVFGTAGSDSSEAAAKTSAAIEYVKPLTKVTLAVTSFEDSKATLSWDAAGDATAYAIYKASAKTGSFELLTEVTDTTYVDTAVTNDEPYFYYVVAKDDAGNTSNPSAVEQAYPSKGHTSNYDFSATAAVIKLVEKSNDTVFADKATLKLSVNKAGVLAYTNQANDKTDNKTVAADATAEFTIALEQGRNIIDVVFTDEDGKKTAKTFSFVSKPAYDILVDAAFTGTDGDTVDGKPTYKTIGAAVASVSDENEKTVVIFVKNGEYNERVVVTAPNVSILGEDSEKTHIFKSVAVSEGSATGMWDRNVMYVDSTATNFTLENVKVENTFAYTNGSDQQADALCIVADKVIVSNVKLYSFQDTLLVDSRVKDGDLYKVTHQYFLNCYITGNVDFIYGSGSAVFDNCDIVGRYTSYKTDGCFVAPRTYSNADYGMVFTNCRFSAEYEVAVGAYRLARPWGKDASCILLNCYVSDVLRTPSGSVTSVYDDMSGNLYVNARFFEYMSYGEGFGAYTKRPQLSTPEVESLNEKIATDIAYMSEFDQMYAAAAPVLPPETGEASNAAVVLLLLAAVSALVIADRKKKLA